MSSTPRGSRPSWRATTSRSAGSTTGRQRAGWHGTRWHGRRAPASAGRAGCRRWCATARCTRGRWWPRPSAPTPGRRAARRSAEAGPDTGSRRHHEPEALAGLRRDVGGVGQLALLLLEIGDLVTQRGFGGGQLLHLGALREVGADRAGDGQGQHTDHSRQDRRPSRGQTEALIRTLLGRFGDRLFDRFDDLGHRTGRRLPATGRRRFARPACHRIAGPPRTRGR